MEPEEIDLSLVDTAAPRNRPVPRFISSQPAAPAAMPILGAAPYLLEDGSWSDAGQWRDSEPWQDGA